MPYDFYPRSPCGERQPILGKINTRGCISIHALLAESDGILVFCGPQGSDFYPRSPCGERLLKNHIFFVHSLFLSTLSLRRATQVKQTCRAKISISIHALLAESDSLGCVRGCLFCISIHALLAESDSKSAQNSGVLLRI